MDGIISVCLFLGYPFHFYRYADGCKQWNVQLHLDLSTSINLQ